MLEHLYARVQPDNISIETVFFDSVAEMDDILGLENLDPAFVAAAKETEAKAGPKWPTGVHGQRPFPFEVKEQIYRHLISESRRISPTTPVTLCAETQRMWNALSDLLEWKPWDYICNCGPHCTPHLRRLAAVEGPDAVRVEKARAEGGIAVGQPRKE